MVEMKDFKRMADEAMSEIYVTEEMKDRVIAKGKNRNRVPAGRLAALAACGILILGGLELTGILKQRNLQGSQPDQQMNIFSATNTAAPGIASAQGPKDTGGAEKSGPRNGQGAVKKWQPANLDEAGTSFGSGFLMPAYTPDSFKLGQINASGTDEKNAVKIDIFYNAGESSFMITEQKESGNANDPELFKEYRKIKIGGSDGYVKTTAPGGNEDSSSVVTEVHWFKNNVHYSVTGGLTQEDALVTAELMLPPGK